MNMEMDTETTTPVRGTVDRSISMSGSRNSERPGLRTWVDPLPEIYRSLDLISELNLVISSEIVKWTRPYENWWTAGGTLAFLSTVSISFYILAVVDVFCQCVLVNLFPEVIVDYPTTSTESTTAGLIFGWFVLMILTMLSGGTAISCLATLYEMAISPRTFTMISLFLVKFMFLCCLLVSYHLMNDRWLTHLLLPCLSKNGISNKYLRDWANLGWVIHFVSFVAFLVFLGSIFCERGKTRPASRLVAALILTIGLMFFSLVGLWFLYFRDYYDRLQIQDPLGMALQQVVILVMVYYVIAPMLILQGARAYTRREINAEDLQALRIIFKAAGFSGVRLEEEIMSRTTIDAKGHVVSLFLYRLDQLSVLPPDIGKLKNLFRLNLERCYALKWLPPEIGLLKHLEKLNLENCPNLKVPPATMGSDRDAIDFMATILKIQNERYIVEEGEPHDKNLIFAACLVPSCAKALGKLYSKHKDLAKITDEDGRTLLDVACKKCKDQMRISTLFAGRYKFQRNSPMYGSDTSTVFFAVDYPPDGSAKASVVLKFVVSKKDFDSERNARTRRDGTRRFLEQHVMSVLHVHNGDEDPNFKDAAKSENPPLPPYCLVLQKGERNLHEHVNAISRSHGQRYSEESLNRVRGIGKSLAISLQHVHEQGFIHGDFKLKNIVLDATSNSWKLIDFDSAVNLVQVQSEPALLSRKVSTAFAPPELVTVRKGRQAVVRVKDGPLAPKGDTSKLHPDWKYLEASVTYDVWSFGAVLFYLLTGVPLIGGVDAQGNLDDNGLNELGNWAKRREERLRRVAALDLSAKRLLEKILHPDARKRPTMEEIIDHDFFHPRRVEARKKKLENDRDRLKDELQRTKQDHKDYKDIKKELENVVRQLERGFEDVTLRLDAIDAEVVRVALQVSNLRSLMVEHQIATTNLLHAILGGKELLPRYLLLLPKAKEGEKWWNLALEWTKPGKWVHKEVKIFFVCPITLSIPSGAVGYDAELDRDWVTKYGPALLVSLRVLKIACALGRLAGLPLPIVSDLPEQAKSLAKDLVSDHAGALSTMYSSLMQDPDAREVGDWLEEIGNEWTDLRLDEGITNQSQENCNAVKRSYDEMRKIVDYVDSDLSELETKCGLVRAFSEDGSKSAFVRRDVVRVFESMGEEAFGMSEDELKKQLNRAIV